MYVWTIGAQQKTKVYDLSEDIGEITSGVTIMLHLRVGNVNVNVACIQTFECLCHVRFEVLEHIME